MAQSKKKTVKPQPVIIIIIIIIDKLKGDLIFASLGCDFAVFLALQSTVEGATGTYPLVSYRYLPSSELQVPTL